MDLATFVLTCLLAGGHVSIAHQARMAGRLLIGAPLSRPQIVIARGWAVLLAVEFVIVGGWGLDEAWWSWLGGGGGFALAAGLAALNVTAWTLGWLAQAHKTHAAAFQVHPQTPRIATGVAAILASPVFIASPNALSRIELGGHLDYLHFLAVWIVVGSAGALLLLIVVVAHAAWAQGGEPFDRRVSRLVAACVITAIGAAVPTEIGVAILVARFGIHY